VTSEYLIRLRGTIRPALLCDFEGLKVVNEDPNTVLRGSVPDQAALFGILARIQALGLELIDVRRLTDDHAA
jgi:hypothetical protein